MGIVGVSLPLSGGPSLDLSSVGIDSLHALEFAQDFLGTQLAFEIRDDQGLPETACRNLREFQAMGITEVFGLALSGTAIVAAQLLRQSASACALSSMASSPALRGFGDVIFRTRPSDKRAAELLAGNIAAQNIKTLGCLIEDLPYPQGVSEVFKAELDALRQNSTTLTFSHHVHLGSLRAFVGANDALFLCAQTEASFHEMLRLVRSDQPRLTIFAMGMPGSRTFRAAAGTLAEEIVYVALDDLSGTPAADRIYAQYQARYGELRSVKYVIPTTMAAVAALAAIAKDRSPRAKL